VALSNKIMQTKKWKTYKTHLNFQHTVVTEYFNTQSAGAHSQPHPWEEIGGRSISGVMCLLDSSRDRTAEPGEEAMERAADWEQSLSERWQSGGIRVHQLEASVRQTQLGVSRTYILPTIIADTIMENQIPYRAQLSGLRPSRGDQVWDMCDGAMLVVGNWGWGGGVLWMWEREREDRGLICNFPRFVCRRVPTVSCLLCYGDSAACFFFFFFFSSLHPTGRCLVCFLIDAGDPPTPGC